MEAKTQTALRELTENPDIPESLRQEAQDLLRPRRWELTMERFQPLLKAMEESDRQRARDAELAKTEPPREYHGGGSPTEGMRLNTLPELQQHAVTWEEQLARDTAEARRRAIENGSYREI